MTTIRRAVGARRGTRRQPSRRAAIIPTLDASDRKMQVEEVQARTGKWVFSLFACSTPGLEPRRIGRLQRMPTCPSACSIARSGWMGPARPASLATSRAARGASVAPVGRSGLVRLSLRPPPASGSGTHTGRNQVRSVAPHTQDRTNRPSRRWIIFSSLSAGQGSQSCRGFLDFDGRRQSGMLKTCELCDCFAAPTPAHVSRCGVGPGRREGRQERQAWVRRALNWRRAYAHARCALGSHAYSLARVRTIAGV